jgi:hypothetical protein
VTIEQHLKKSDECDVFGQDIEQQALDARNLANEKKKIFNEFKDDACKTRWGGKILCLRPFGSGY